MRVYSAILPYHTEPRSLSCRAAVKAGDPLAQPEVDRLVADRHRYPGARHCPHGRPTSLLLSRRELDRQFRRT